MYMRAVRLFSLFFPAVHLTQLRMRYLTHVTHRCCNVTCHAQLYIPPPSTHTHATQYSTGAPVSHPYTHLDAIKTSIMRHKTHNSLIEICGCRCNKTPVQKKYDVWLRVCVAISYLRKMYYTYQYYLQHT